MFYLPAMYGGSGGKRTRAAKRFSSTLLIPASESSIHFRAERVIAE